MKNPLKNVINTKTNNINKHFTGFEENLSINLPTIKFFIFPAKLSTTKMLFSLLFQDDTLPADEICHYLVKRLESLASLA